jgi:hypothetical protein
MLHITSNLSVVPTIPRPNAWTNSPAGHERSVRPYDLMVGGGSGKKYKKCGMLNTEEHQKFLAEKK